eukprot:2307348-Amphidinium_carterae.1
MEIWTAAEPPASMSCLPWVGIYVSGTASSRASVPGRKGWALHYLGGGDFDGDKLWVCAHVRGTVCDEDDDDDDDDGDDDDDDDEDDDVNDDDGASRVQQGGRSKAASATGSNTTAGDKGPPTALEVQPADVAAKSKNKAPAASSGEPQPPRLLAVDPILQSAKIASGSKLHSVQLSCGPAGLAVAIFAGQTFVTQ